MSLAATRRRGLPLNCRFAVNGIQKASRLFGDASNSGRAAAFGMAGLGLCEDCGGILSCSGKCT
jgi:hypothetical protein